MAEQQQDESDDRQAADGDPEPRPVEPYERPEVHVIGTVMDLTRGSTPGLSDALGMGSPL